MLEPFDLHAYFSDRKGKVQNFELNRIWKLKINFWDVTIDNLRIVR